MVRGVVCVFFVQAEDGIRDLVRSRGLGDVYKRQLEFGARQRQYEGDGIIVAGITIENNGQRHGQTPYLSLIHI